MSHHEPATGQADDREPLRGAFPQPEAHARRNPKEGASLGTLVADMPRLFIDLAKDEVEQAKRELVGKGKKLGAGAGMLAAAAFFALTMYAVLVAAAVMGIATALPDWLAALIVAAGFLVITVILALIGISVLRKGTPVAPEDTIESVKQDVNAMKGLGQYE